MHLRTVELTDWRSYRRARFEFPAPDGCRNVILVRGGNENGKTSLFEAIALGLFGRSGLTLVPRANISVTGDIERRQAISYSNFMAGVLHHRAISLGRQMSSVRLGFEDDDGDAIEITRSWFFGANGDHKAPDDELTIYEGRGRRPVQRPASITDVDAWRSDFIASNLIPSHLAEFFLFDGEQVQRYAESSMTDQIRKGMDGLLGLQIIRSLKESLQEYVQKKRSKTRNVSDGNIDRIIQDIERLSREMKEREKIVAEASQPLRDLEAEIQEIIQRIGGGGEATMALVGQLAEEEQRFIQEAERNFERLMGMLGSNLAIALSGSDLRKRTLARLESEKIREGWESAKSEVNSNLERYLEDLRQRLRRLEPPIPADREDEIVSAAGDAWFALWHPAPVGCADGYRHSGLTGTARQRAIARLEAASRQSAGELSQSVAGFRDAAGMAQSKKRQRLQIEVRAPEVERLTERLQRASEEAANLRSRRDEAERDLRARESELAARRTELGRMQEARGRHAPDRQRADRAHAYSDLIDEILKEATPTQNGLVAKAMTEVWKSMAQLDDRLDRIDIDEECRVRMLNRRNEDIHDIEMSAGAKQIFTQALICAITKVSRWNFPFVVDTPMARLSKEHRFGTLRAFADRPGQVILLCTDAEVVGDELEQISDRVIVEYRLHLDHDVGVPITRIERIDR